MPESTTMTSTEKQCVKDVYMIMLERCIGGVLTNA